MSRSFEATPPPAERLHALDAARAFALLLGVAFHATMSYLPDPQIWIVRDTQSEALGGVFYVSHIFRMTVFFLLAGFFGRMLFHKRGVAGFIGNRAKRIALPLVVFWLPVFAAIVACFVWGFVATVGPEVAAQTPEPPSPFTVEAFPLTHLWFLYLLLIFYVVVLLVRGIVVAIDRKEKYFRGDLDAFVARVVASPLGFLEIAGPIAVVLFFTPGWLMWFGVPTPDTGLIPNGPAFIAYGAAFCFGWLLQRQMHLLDALRKRWARNLLIAIALTAGLLAWMGLAPVIEPAADMSWEKGAYAAAYAAAIWTWTLGLIGAALQFLSKENPVIRYIADGSYWVYIVHLPVVMALQVVAFAYFDLPAAVEYTLLLVAAFAICFASYDLLVRYSFIGKVLNGVKRSRKERARNAPANDVMEDVR